MGSTTVVYLSGIFSPDSKYFALSGCINLESPSNEASTRFCELSKTVIIDLDIGTISQQIENQFTDIYEMAFSANSSFLAVAGVQDESGKLLIWSLANGMIVREMISGRGISNLAFSPSGEYLVTFSFPNTFSEPHLLSLWRTNDWNLTAEYQFGWGTCCLLFIPGTDTILMSNMADGGLGVFDPIAQELLEIETLNGIIKWLRKFRHEKRPK